ncbi:hypothetical protein CXB51_013621 [Gossypium anomalum]|uniref:DUF4283 domain-containing protein n=1 Tax=Gossypium anomalum TaxID=47600 RepID=A0A8J5Z8H2_9ROSI|nr:hypothetical protein CXB51_013621 [Gossypium anomalum]
MEANIANMSLKNEEEESIPCEREPNNDDEDRRFCLVGRILIDCVIHFPSLKITMADLWHPLGGASVNFPPIEYRIWVHNLPYGVILEGLARKLGGSVGQFIQYSVAMISRGEQRYMKFRVKIDMRLALKREKADADKMTRGLRTIEIQEVIFGWNLPLRAPSRNELLAGSIWLTEELPSGIKKGNSSVGMELYGQGRRRIDGEDFSQGEWSMGQREAITEDTPRDRQPLISVLTRMEKVQGRCGFTNGIDVGAQGSKGGLSIGWKREDEVQLRSYSANHIDVVVMVKGRALTWRLTCFCGASEEHNRRESWNLLRRLGNSRDMP